MHFNRGGSSKEQALTTWQLMNKKNQEKFHRMAINDESKQSDKVKRDVQPLVGVTAAIHLASPSNKSGTFAIEQVNAPDK